MHVHLLPMYVDTDSDVSYIHVYEFIAMCIKIHIHIGNIPLKTVVILYHVFIVYLVNHYIINFTNTFIDTFT